MNTPSDARLRMGEGSRLPFLFQTFYLRERPARHSRLLQEIID